MEICGTGKQHIARQCPQRISRQQSGREIALREAGIVWKYAELENSILPDNAPREFRVSKADEKLLCEKWALCGNMRNWNRRRKMLKGLYTAYTGMINEQHRMDVMTNNLANANTNGYKKEGATSQAFSDVFAFKLKDTSEAARTTRSIGINNLGVKIGEGYTDYSQGPMKGTENSYDLALSGQGFFTVSYTNKNNETSIKYTRDGSFRLGTNGYLMTHDGDFVLSTTGSRIRLNPLLDFRVDINGNIMQGEDNTPVAQLRIRDFVDYNYLEKFGENYFQPVDGARFQDAEAKVYQGYLETANMSVVTEMVNMINISRAYETNQKVIQTYDSTLETAVTQIGRL